MRAPQLVHLYIALIFTHTIIYTYIYIYKKMKSWSDIFLQMLAKN
jgi:hypothetical protein